jgi:hypothetical protein
VTPAQVEPVSAETAAVPLAEPATPTWAEPTVDYGPVTDTPVVDMPVFEKQLSAPPVQSKKRSQSSALSAAKSAPAPKKNRMCWDNGIVAPCK